MYRKRLGIYFYSCMLVQDAAEIPSEFDPDTYVMQENLC